MRIKELRRSSRQGGKIRLTFDDGSTLAVSPVVDESFALYPGMELDEAQLAALKKSASEASARERAVRIISLTGVTRADLEHRLVQKGESAKDAQAAVAWLDELSLLDDAEVARQIVQRGAAKGYGANRIRQMLYEKRVPRAYWDEALAGMPETDGALDSFLQKKFAGCTDRAAVNRAIQAAARRGYSWSEIKSAMRRYNDALELEEET